MLNSCSVIIATYNEVENVELLVQKLTETLDKKIKKYEIIIIDDNSPDKTFEKLLLLSNNYKTLRPILRTSEQGLARSIWEGIRAVRHESIIIMDSDLSHMPSEIPEMIDCLDNGNLMVWRSRYVNGGKIENSPDNSLQFVLSRFFNIFLMRLLKIPVLDTTNGYFAFKSCILEKGNFEKYFQGYGDFSFLFLYALIKNNIISKNDVVEIPSTYKQRIAGESKTKLFKVGLSYSCIALKARFSSVTLNK
jgi:dolichol-phosphate mannosyltransferase